MNNKMNTKMKIFLLALLAISIAIIPNVSAENTQNFSIYPTCNLTEIPTFGDWVESWDGSNNQYYCQDVVGEMWTEQKIFYNRLGEPFTSSNSDVWKPINFTVDKGNLRNVEVSFEYYAPSKNGVCVHTSINSVTGYYNSLQSILIGNSETNLSEKASFDVAFYDFNNEIVCDQWRTFNHTVADFTNDFGSSFSGQSKDLGSIGFEAKNIFIKNVLITGDVNQVEVW